MLKMKIVSYRPLSRRMSARVATLVFLPTGYFKLSGPAKVGDPVNMDGHPAKDNAYSLENGDHVVIKGGRIVEFIKPPKS